MIKKIDKAEDYSTRLDSVEETEEMTENNKKEVKVAKSETMGKVLKLVSDEFNLEDDYVLVAFKDGNNNCSVVLANEDFEVAVKVKSKENSNLL